MIRFIIYVIIFYLFWKIIRVFMRYLNTSKNGNPDIKNTRNEQSKYKNIEEAKYTEIKDEDKDND